MQPALNKSDRFIDRDLLRFSAFSLLHVYELFIDSVFTDRYPQRYADEVGILEFNTGSFVAVVKQRLDALGTQTAVNLVGAFHLNAVINVHRYNNDGKRRYGFRENDAVVVM